LVTIPLLAGEHVTGQVNLVLKEAGDLIRIGGKLTGTRMGSFTLASRGKEVSGRILLPHKRLAYEIAKSPDGQLVMQEKSLSEVVCFPLPRSKDEPAFGSAHPQQSAKRHGRALLGFRR
jgi:hypothetical protein